MTNPEAPALRADARAPHPWQPIESAPTDRTLVLVALIKDGTVWRVSDAAFNGLGWYTKSGEACHWRTHWAPLPPVASASTGSAGSDLGQLIQEWESRAEWAASDRCPRDFYPQDAFQECAEALRAIFQAASNTVALVEPASTGSAGDPTPHPKEGDFRTCRYCAEAHLEVFSERYGLKSDGWLHVETWVKLALLERSDLVAARDRLAHALAQQQEENETLQTKLTEAFDSEVHTSALLTLERRYRMEDAAGHLDDQAVTAAALRAVKADRDRLAGGLVVLQREFEEEKEKNVARGDRQPDPLAPLPQPPSGEQ